MSEEFNSVWDALEPTQSTNMKLRAELMIKISEFVKNSGLTQAQAAKQLQTTQPRLSDVMNGRIDKCTVDRLVNMLDCVNFKVSMTISLAT